MFVFVSVVASPTDATKLSDIEIAQDSSALEEFLASGDKSNEPRFESEATNNTEGFNALYNVLLMLFC